MMLWRDAIDTLDMEAAAAQLAQLKVIGAFNLTKSRVTKEDIGELVKKKHQQLIALGLSDAAMRQKLVEQIYSRAWTGTSAANPDREALVLAVCGVEPKTKKRDLASVGDAALEERLLNGYAALIVTTLSAKNIDLAAITAQVQESLTAGQWNELRQILGTDTLTAEGIGTLVKTVAIGGGGVALVNAAGFAAYMALTTAMASVAGALGATLPFAAYTSATTTMAFLTGPFALALIGSVGLIPLLRVNRKVARSVLAQSLASLRIIGAAPIAPPIA